MLRLDETMNHQTNYIIRGADGLEYGPVSADQVREWVAQNRANQDSWIRVEGEEVGGRLGERPEFTALFRPEGQVVQATDGDPSPAAPVANGAGAGLPVTPPGPTAGAATGTGKEGSPTAGAASGAGDRLADEILARGYSLRIGDCFGRSWGLLKQRFLLTAGACLLVVALYIGLSSFPVIGTLAAMALGAVLFGGLDLMFLRLLRGQPADFGVAFSGFGPLFLPLVLVGLISQVLTGIGLLLCLLPGIYLMVAWGMFAPLLVMDRGLDFWQALECSRRVVTRHWWACFGLLLVCLLILLGGALLLGVGLVVALPWVTGAIVVAYEQIFGQERGGTP